MRKMIESARPFHAKALAILIVAALIAAVVGCGPEAVTFADPNLEGVIREAIDKPTGDIYPEDLEGLTELHAVGRIISDLTGLEYATNLRSLGLAGNQISDISPLANLTELTFLDIMANQISDISPLAGLSNLERLDLSGNEISDIAPLERLTGLQELDLVVNQIVDISPLEGLTNLTHVHLGENQIGDIYPLRGFTNLEWLILQHNEISDISPLVDNPGLGEGDEVWLIDNPLSEQSINEFIPELEARGVDVRY